MSKYKDVFQNFSGKCDRETAYAILGLLLTRAEEWEIDTERRCELLASGMGRGKEYEHVERMKKNEVRASAVKQLVLEIDEWCDEQGFDGVVTCQL